MSRISLAGLCHIIFLVIHLHLDKSTYHPLFYLSSIESSLSSSHFRAGCLHQILRQSIPSTSSLSGTFLITLPDRVSNANPLPLDPFDEDRTQSWPSCPAHKAHFPRSGQRARVAFHTIPERRGNNNLHAICFDFCSDVVAYGSSALRLKRALRIPR